MTYTDFAQRLLVYCFIHAGSVTSWGRTSQHNTLVGGVPQSAHRFWLAADVVYDDPPPVQKRQEIADRLGLRLVVEADHDHLQPADWKAG